MAIIRRQTVVFYLMVKLWNGTASVKHIGNIVSSDIAYTNDCALKRGRFVSSVNKLIGNYGDVQIHMILCRLFSSYYCCSLYGSEIIKWV